MAQGSAATPHGLHLVGVLRGGRVAEGRERPNGEGRYPDRYHLHVGVGDDVYRVEYESEDSARMAVESVNGSDVQPGDAVTVLVRARAGARGGADAFIFWSGARDRAEAEVSW